MAEEKLTAKMENYCLKLVELGQGNEAYRQSYNAKNMSDVSIGVEVARLNKDPRIVARVGELRQAYRDKIGVNTERVLQEKARLAFADIRKLFHANGELKSIHELDDETAAAIASIEVEARLVEPKGKKGKLGVTRTAKVKLYDKGHALSDLMRHLGMFEKDNVQKADALSRLLVTMGSMNAPTDPA